MATNGALCPRFQRKSGSSCGYSCPWPLPILYPAVRPVRPESPLLRFVWENARRRSVYRENTTMLAKPELDWSQENSPDYYVPLGAKSDLPCSPTYPGRETQCRPGLLKGASASAGREMLMLLVTAALQLPLPSSHAATSTAAAPQTAFRPRPGLGRHRRQPDPRPLRRPFQMQFEVFEITDAREGPAAFYTAGASTCQYMR